MSNKVIDQIQLEIFEEKQNAQLAEEFDPILKRLNILEKKVEELEKKSP